MKKEYLGKPVPVHQPNHHRKHRIGGTYGWMILVLPIVCSGFLLSLQKNSLNNAPRTTGGALARTLADNTNGTSVSTSTTKVCTYDDLSKAFLKDNKLISVFPIVPDSISASNPSSSSANCSPANWPREIVFFFLLKALAVLNWFAWGAAVILVIYAGILYMLGYANENNVAAAKKWLSGIVIGIIVVILARSLVYAAIDSFSSGSVQDAIEEGVPFKP